MKLFQATILFFAALPAGAINAVVGGAFVSFPTLLLLGIPPGNANASNTVALWPVQVASIGAYRRQLRNLSLLITALPAAFWAAARCSRRRRQPFCDCCRG